METDDPRPTAQEAAAALRQVEGDRESLRSLPARPWLYPSLAVTAMTFITDRHDDAVGVREKSAFARPADLVIVAPGIAVFVVAGAFYTQYHQAWGVPVAAVALAGSILAIGLVRGRRAHG